MNEAVPEQHREPLSGGSAGAASASRLPLGHPKTLVALVMVANRLPPGAAPRCLAAALPIVDREAYEILGEVGRGGIGRILRARSVHLGRPVAIKELLEPGDAAEERFVYEARITARLQHPSIVSVHEAGRWPTGELFYAMKLVSGRTLAEVLDDPREGGSAGSPGARLAPTPWRTPTASASSTAI
jgi:eukaryotic-like serine/threonine-protein kinase